MLHILVIEDDEFFNEMLVQMLQQDGHKVTATHDGIKAMHLLQRIKPDLIITDILMPNMDGVELILKLSQNNIETPVIAMSGGRRSITSEFNLDSARLLGVKATLGKPFSHVDLRRSIQEAMT